MQTIAFTPAGTITIAAVNNTSVRGALPSSTNQDKQLEILNPTNGIIYVKCGDSTVAAAVTDYPIQAGGVRRIGISGAETHIAVFLTSGATNGNVFATRGEGI
jgi:hypothetical protein